MITISNQSRRELAAAIERRIDPKRAYVILGRTLAQQVLEALREPAATGTRRKETTADREAVNGHK